MGLGGHVRLRPGPASGARRLKPLMQLAPSTRQSAHHRTDRRTGDFGGLLVGGPVDAYQRHQHLLFWGKFAHGVENGLKREAALYNIAAILTWHGLNDFGV